MSNERQRLEELLPFYLNGTLADADRQFVQDALREQPDLSSSVAFSERIQQAVQALAPEQAPDPARINRLLARLSNAKPQIKTLPSHNRWFSGWLMALSGMGVAAVTATLVLGVGTLPPGLLHADGLDGQADVRLSLAEGIDPDHEMVVAQLQNHHGVIVSQSQQDGRYVIEVDLQSRAASQHNLIQSLQASGHIDGYTLLASR
ncbi:hypothetical protein [Orrella daihaiensis]|uniref:Zinc-finger domain-containing protein n=1 Tax=Orrella daihaiensis TaxID=2782176 RepID=A0ABY4AJA4_9BURK|nr:hypothetical protein [Orrella daihaiensis]UOD50369.1 hypothetical protein DHf2319_13245 [Orrella daihaiensis]